MSLIRDVRDFLTYVRDEVGRLRDAGLSADDAADAIDQAARIRWSTWERPEWISSTARAFYDGVATD